MIKHTRNLLVDNTKSHKNFPSISTRYGSLPLRASEMTVIITQRSLFILKYASPPPPPKKKKRKKITKKKKKTKGKNILFIPLQRLLHSALTLSILSLHAPFLTSSNTENERTLSLVYKYEGIFCFWLEKDCGFITYGAVVGCFIYTLLFEFSCCF